jgi:XTP/dITP diphosphohydrolase
MKLILASNNKDKLREIKEILDGTGIEIISQREAGCDFEAIENGDTFEENARIKAKAAMERTGLACVADDSGIEINAMHGGPGIFSSRYVGDRTYEEICHTVIEEIEGTDDRGADYYCAVVCIFPNGDEISVSGRTDGTIAFEPKGTGGFGYDPIFVPDGYTETMAEISEEEKNKISHRGRAFREFAKKLSDYMERKDIKE